MPADSVEIAMKRGRYEAPAEPRLGRPRNASAVGTKLLLRRLQENEARPHIRLGRSRALERFNRSFARNLTLLWCVSSYRKAF
jgi:hypothetical protein